MNILVRPALLLGPQGFAKAARALILALSRTGARVALADPVYRDGVVPESHYIQLLDAASFKPSSVDVEINIAPAFSFSFTQERAYKIGFSMFETRSFHADFKRASYVCDEIWVPSKFCYDTYLRLTEANIAYVPIPIDFSLYELEEPNLRIVERGGGEFDFVFGTICGYSFRKGVDLLLVAFMEEFSGENVALFFKSFGNLNNLLDHCKQLRRGEGEVFNYVEVDRFEFLRRMQKPPTILYNFETLSDLQLIEVERAIGCLVLPSRGEGFGLPALECLALGKPVIATQATGLADFVTGEGSFPIPVLGWGAVPECDWISPYYVGAEFAYPDYAWLKEWMRYVFENREKLKFVPQAREVAELFEVNRVAKWLRRRLEGIERGEDARGFDYGSFINFSKGLAGESSGKG